MSRTMVFRLFDCRIHGLVPSRVTPTGGSCSLCPRRPALTPESANEAPATTPERGDVA